MENNTIDFAKGKERLTRKEASVHGFAKFVKAIVVYAGDQSITDDEEFMKELRDAYNNTLPAFGSVDRFCDFFIEFRRHLVSADNILRSLNATSQSDTEPSDNCVLVLDKERIIRDIRIVPMFMNGYDQYHH